MSNINMCCRSCGNKILDTVFHISDKMPWCNNFLTKEEIGNEKLYPLTLLYCNQCTLTQLNYTVPKESMFLDHTYVSGTTNTLKEHFYKLALENVRQFDLKKYDIIVDIGGNDGTQLLQYKKINNEFGLINVESATKIANISENNGIATFNMFFNEENVDKNFRMAIGRVKLISAAGVFFHLEELHSVIRGIKKLLSDNGVLVVQFMYLQDMIVNHTFDNIYHEHLCYYTLESLRNLLEPYGLYIFDAYHSPIHYGSIIAKISPNGIRSATARYITTLKNEKNSTKKYVQYLQSWSNYIANELHTIIKNLKEEGKKIYAYGAPAKGTTLLCYANLTNELIEKAVEANPLKVGLYIPKVHIPIVAESNDDIPDYYLLLSYNFIKEILLKNEEKIKNGLQFILPFPQPAIINKENYQEYIHD